MKKKWTSALLAALLAAALLLPQASAATVQFADVTDEYSAVAVETLRLMGVLDGYGDGTFRPAGYLTRAQFCKMATYALCADADLGRYATVTVFPDVKPSHWAANYINLAAKGKGVIAGYPDGRFYPERTVTAAQACTILLRALGYKDQDSGGVWPDGYMALAEAAGLLENAGVKGGNAPLTREQAARLFLNLLRAKKKDGGTLYTLGDETTLLSLDGGEGTMKTTDKTYTMKKSAPSTTLAGTRGQVVLNADGEALTFLPASSGATGSASAAVIVYRSGSTAGFDALAGNNRYTIYKNGAAATAADLRENDVATYSAATNAIRVCDTRVTAYYEDCSPSPSAAVTVTILGGTKFSVLPSAQSALSDFRPGDAVTFLLSADGQIAGALKPGANAASRGNAAGVVDASGKTWLVCGGTAIPLAVTASDTKYYGKVVEFYSASKDRVGMSEIGYTGLGDLNVAERKLGGTPLAENALVFDGGALVALSSLDRTVPASDVAYARTNWAGKVDLIVLRGAEELTFYGRAVVNENSDGRRTIGVEYGAGKSFGPFGSKYSIRNGDFVKATLNREQSGYTDMTILDKVESVTSAEWIGNAAVTHGGKTYTVAASTPCYSADSGKWMSVEAARDYAVSYNLYVTDNVVRVIELVK